MDDKLIQQILGIVIPEEILEDFEIERIEEREEERVFHMVEKESRKPEAGEELLKDGYMRPKDVVHYPSGMKRCTIRLKRHRWVSKANRSRCYYNQYSYTEEGCKATRQFATFLKEIDGKRPV